MEESDQKVITRVREGDIDLYESIVTRYQRQVWAQVASMLWDHNETADLVQQVFLKAYAQLDVFDVERAFWPWLKLITRNLVIDHLRMQRSERQTLNRYREYLAQKIADRPAEEDARLKEALETCRADLSQQAEEALRLRYDLKMGFEEVSQQLGRSPSATQRLIARVRAALRDCINRKMTQYDPA